MLKDVVVFKGVGVIKSNKEAPLGISIVDPISSSILQPLDAFYQEGSPLVVSNSLVGNLVDQDFGLVIDGMHLVVDSVETAHMEQVETFGSSILVGHSNYENTPLAKLIPRRVRTFLRKASGELVVIPEDKPVAQIPGLIPMSRTPFTRIKLKEAKTNMVSTYVTFVDPINILDNEVRITEIKRKIKAISTSARTPKQ